MDSRALLSVGFVASLAIGACGRAIAPEPGDDDDLARPSQVPPGTPTGNAARGGPKVPTPARPGGDPPVLPAKTSFCGQYMLPPEEVLTRFAPSGHVGLFRVVRVDEECSGLGGTHVELQYVGGCGDPRAPLHLGGHGCSAEETWPAGTLVVAAWDRVLSDWANPAWCVGDLPEYGGATRAGIPVVTVEEGRKLLADVGCAP